MGVVVQIFFELGFYLNLIAIINCLSALLYDIALDQVPDVVGPTLYFIMGYICCQISFIMQDCAYWFDEFLPLVTSAPTTSIDIVMFWAGESVQLLFLCIFLVWVFETSKVLLIIAAKDIDKRGDHGVLDAFIRVWVRSMLQSGSIKLKSPSS